MAFRLAFAKGRGAADCIRLLEAGGLDIPPQFYEGRLTVHSATGFDVLCVLVRGSDIAQLLARGHVDAAVGSSLLFEEYGGTALSSVASLAAGACRLSLLTQDERSKAELGRVCTRYPKITMKMLRGVRPGIEVFELRGCVESALFLGLCDAITDIVETGWTLSALSLKEREVLCRFSHGIWLRQDTADRHLQTLARLMPSVAWASPPAQFDLERQRACGESGRR